MADRTAIPITRRIEGLPIIVVFVLLLGLFMVTAPQVFLAPFIYTTFLSTLPPLILLAVGLTFVIGSGEIDLSFPAIIGFAGFVFAVLFKEYELGWLSVLAGLAAGTMVGFLNGLLIAKVGIPVLHHHARHPVPLVRHGDRALRRQVLRPSRRRPDDGLERDRRPAAGRRRRDRPGSGRSRCRRSGRRRSWSSSGSS